MKNCLRKAYHKANPWALFGFDPYPLIRPFLFLLNPELAHEMTIKMLKFGLGPQFFDDDDPLLRTPLFGLDFPNPIGLAAGLDKQAQVIDAFMHFGFGHVEVGTVTPLPQPGNPKPRMFRATDAKALINRFGFNSIGADAFAENLGNWRHKPRRSQYPLGVNIGRNKDSKDEAADYVTCLIKMAPYADFLTVNISSPNTPGLRELQGRKSMTRLLGKIMDARKAHAPNMPILVKIAPDVTDDQQKDIAAVALSSGVHGLIVGNTTLSRPSNIPRDVAKEEGGLSGGPLFSLSTRVLGNMYRFTEGKIPLIGCGGIGSGEDAYLKIRAGASMLQIYTALIFEGPWAVRRIKRELAALLRRDRFASLAEAVGADLKA